jgi:hypothetical protein
MLTNPTAAAIEVEVTYTTGLGSDGDGTIDVIGDNAGFSTWDLRNEDRDVGVVYGAGVTLGFESAEVAARTNVDTAFVYETLEADSITAKRTVIVEPGTTVTLVSFTILSTEHTAATALASTERAALVEEVANDILTNYATDGQFRTGMTQQQIDTTINF